MNHETIDPCSYYDIIDKVHEGSPKSAAWWRGPSELANLYPPKLRVAAKDIDESHSLITAQIKQAHAAAMVELRNSLPQRHDQFLEQQGLPTAGRAMRTKFGVRTAHCTGYRHPINSATMPECNICHAIVCEICAGCGCGSGVWIQPYGYSKEKQALLDVWKNFREN